MSEHAPEKVPEKGLLSFIKTKLEHSIHPRDIKRMLMRAGFSEEHIHNAFNHVRKAFKDTHQDVVAANDFLPPLSKDTESHDTTHGGLLAQNYMPHHAVAHTVEQKGLFAGRLRRKDFVLGFLFFFGIGYTIIAFASLILAHFMPDLWQAILDAINNDSNNFLLMLIPVLLLPITIMMMSLIARRLHNLGLPGGLALFFLLWFMPSFEQVYSVGFFALESVLLILFVVLVTVKGNPAPNKYGPLPGSRGSFFKRIFNI